jgi:TatD DNase family protein
MARDLVRRGWYISFTGVITYKNAPVVQASAKAVPLDRILVETDAPYLAPVPFRGKTNRSDYIEYTLATLAGLHGVTVDEMRAITNENACKLFGIQ